MSGNEEPVGVPRLVLQEERRQVKTASEFTAQIWVIAKNTRFLLVFRVPADMREKARHMLDRRLRLSVRFLHILQLELIRL